MKYEVIEIVTAIVPEIVIEIVLGKVKFQVLKNQPYFSAMLSNSCLKYCLHYRQYH